MKLLKHTQISCILLAGIMMFYGCSAQNSDQKDPATTITEVSFMLPNAPTGLTAQGMTGAVLLHWNSVSGAPSYNIYWQYAAGVNKFSSNIITNVNSGYKHNGLGNGIEYFYAITAIVGGVESNLSVEISSVPISEDTVNWNKSFSSAGINVDIADTIAIDSSGNVYVAGYGYNLVTGTSGVDWWIKKFTSAGIEDTINWNKSFNSGIGYPDIANSIAIDSGGNVYVAGAGANLVNGTSGSDWWIKKFTSAGVEDTVNWNKSFSSAGTSSDVACSIAIDSGGNVYVAGYGYNLVLGTSGVDWWIKKFTSAGVEDTVFWNKRFNSAGTNDDMANSIAIDRSGNVYVAGYGYNLVTGTSGFDWWIKKFTSTGVEDTVNWNKSFSSGINADMVYSIAIDSVGNVYMAGYGTNLLNGTSGYDWWIKKFTSAGVEDTVNWNKTFSSSGHDVVFSIAIDSGGNIYIAGYGYANWWIKKLSSTGIEDTIYWNKSFHSVDIQGEIAYSIAIDGAGNVYVAGYGYNLGTVTSGADWWIKKFYP
jgi:uncharacterized delta-60 repeat protein